MWWCKRNAAWRRAAAVAVVLAAAGLTAGCFQPLLGTQPSAATDSVRDKLQQVDVPVIVAPKGQTVARIAVALRNSLQYGLNGAAGANAPTYTLKVGVGVTNLSIIVDITSGRPDAQVASVIANYQLIEIATGKVVLSEFDLCPCRLRHSGRGATLRQAARGARCRRPRHRGRLRRHQEPAGVVLRRRHLEHDPEKWVPVFG